MILSKYISLIRAFLHYRIYVKIYQPHIEHFIIKLQQKTIVRRLKNKEFINIVFLPMSVAMWKYQHLYELLQQNKRFRLFVFLSPATTYSNDARCKDIEDMRHYFNEHNVPFIDYELEKGKNIVDIRTIVDPDILFYTQPYEKVVETEHDFTNFGNKLLCHTTYSTGTLNSNFHNYNMRFYNIAWKLYFPTLECKEFAIKNAYNHGQNAVYAGYSSVDDYLLPPKNDPWKNKDRTIKRIIWAPHFTIIKNIGFSQMSNFLHMAEFMRNLAVEYSDRVAFAFKPHPRLYSELVKHPDWGEEKAKEYYDFWSGSPTTQLETGEFIDLFKGSDAMIHDSGSFTVDYLYFDNPVLYDNPNIEAAKTTASETGKAAYDVHYKVTCNEDIRAFIDDVVIGGHDTMKAEREEYYNKYLRPPGGKSVAQNIYDDLIKSLDI